MLNSISSYSSVGTRKGVGGLASGLDTDALVEGMTSSTRDKILKQLQSKQVLEWKMEGYQSISSKMTDFTNKYMSYANPDTNVFSSKFFENYSITSNGKNSGSVTVTGNTGALDGLSIKSVDRLATTAGFMTTKNASTQKFSTDKIDFSAEGKTINNLAGETVYLKYGNTLYNVKIDENFQGTDAKDIAKAFNEALKKVKIDDDTTLADKVTMGVELGVDEEGNAITNFTMTAQEKAFSINGGNANILKALGFDETTKAEAGKTVKTLYEEENATHQLVFKDTIAGKYMSFEYNGVTKSIQFPDKDSDELDDINSAEGLAEYVNEKLAKSFGNGRIEVTADGAAGTLSFKTVDNNSTLSVLSGGANLIGSDSVFGMSAGEANRLRLDKPLSELVDELGLRSPTIVDGKKQFIMNVNDATFTFSEDVSIGSMINAINNSDAGVKIKYLSTTDKFTITATESGSNGKVDISDDSTGGNLAEALFGKKGVAGDNIAGNYVVDEGVDAQMKISYDGREAVTITRNSNAFSLDGSNFTLNSTFDSSVEGSEAITFTSKNNTDDMIKVIKEMVTAYNEINDLVNKEMSTKRDRKYEPLSKEQEDSMTEGQIKQWNEKAQAGMLFGDSTLQSLSSDLRMVFSLPVNGNALRDIGITTSASYGDNGKVSISNETTLKAALEKDPEKIKKMFLADGPSSEGLTADGVMTKMKAVSDKYVSTIGDKGELVRIAGLKDSLSVLDSALYKQMAAIDSTVDRLSDTLKSQEDRYYSQFTQLEKYISQMNSQSSWFSQQMGG